MRISQEKKTKKKTKGRKMGSLSGRGKDLKFSPVFEANFERSLPAIFELGIILSHCGHTNRQYVFRNLFVKCWLKFRIRPSLRPRLSEKIFFRQFSKKFVANFFPLRFFASFKFFIIFRFTRFWKSISRFLVRVRTTVYTCENLISWKILRFFPFWISRRFCDHFSIRSRTPFHKNR